MGLNIALDGPSGAGKSTIAKLTARKLGFVYVDTGALYRAIAYSAIQNSVALDDEQAVTASLDGIKLALAYNDGVQSVLVNGADVSDKIRSPEISMGASKISKYAKVREFLLDTQRNIARENDVIMDGRDIGTVVLPEAQVKIFLTASAEQRAQRRFKELFAKGDGSTYEEVLADINQRDYNDTHREIAPLKQADGAKVIDSTEMTIDEVVDSIIEAVDDVKKNSLNKADEPKPRRSRELMPLSPVTGTHKLSLPHIWFYAFIRAAATLVLKLIYDIRFEGVENVPKDGGNIFASNHRSYGDPVFIALKTRVPISYMAKEELFKQNIFFTLLIKTFGAFPVKRGSGDTGVIDTAVGKLEKGRNLVIFPEGTRSKDGKVGRGKTGVALIGAVAQTKIVPVGINFEGEKLAFRKKVLVRYGKPVDVRELGIEDTSSKSLKVLKNKIMEEITKLVY